MSKVCHNKMLSVATKYGVNCLNVVAAGTNWEYGSHL